MLSPVDRNRAQDVDLCMAAGKAQTSLILDGEIFVKQMRRPLIPLSKLIERTGLSLVWTSSGMLLKACDKNGRMRVVLRPRTRQGHMPHVPINMLSPLREVLKRTRLQMENLLYEDWLELFNRDDTGVNNLGPSNDLGSESDVDDLELPDLSVSSAVSRAGSVQRT
eukprot:1821613-Amphidinium_carterae.1